MGERNDRRGALYWACGLVALTSCAEPSSPASTEGARFLKPTSGIRGIFEERDGKLWFTSPDWTCRFDPSAVDAENGGFTYFPPESAGVVIDRFKEDSEGRVWMQSTDGIHAYDGANFTPVSDRNFAAPDRWRKSDGDVWFGLDGSFAFSAEEGQWGVYRYHEGECTFLAFPEPPAGERHHFYPLTSEVMRGADGMLWFGTFNAAFGFDGESFDIVGRERMGRTDDPRDIGIRGYHLDSRGNLWMADNGAGVYVYDGDSVLHFTALHGLTDEDTEGNSLHRAFSIAEDNDGSIWIGSVYSGIWRYEPSISDPLGQGTFTNFDDEQGWPCENAWTIYKTRSGELLFAGEDPGGVYQFNGETFDRVY